MLSVSEYFKRAYPYILSNLASNEVFLMEYS